MPENQITDSRFYMWRAVFAMAHADNIVTPEEEKFMRDALETYPFSDHQKTVLENDMCFEADIWELFLKITDKHDKSDFFKYARLIVWCDGDYDEQEREILSKLKSSHFRSLSDEEMKREAQIVLDDKEKKEMKERMLATYKSLQEKQSQGGYFGAVVRKMWADTTE